MIFWTGVILTGAGIAGGLIALGAELHRKYGRG